MAAGSGRRVDPEAKRAALLDAALRLFARQGYSATTTAAIAGEAGVATGTLFRFFADKAMLLSALHIDIETRFADAMSDAWDRASGPAPDRFEPMYAAIFDVAGELGESMTVVAMGVGAQADGHRPGSIIRPRIEAQYVRAVAAGEFVSLPPPAVARIVAGMVDGALKHWMDKPTPHRRREAIRTLTELSRRAFSA